MGMWGQQMSDEFAMSAAVKRRGFSTVEAYEFVRSEFPDIKEWHCWDAHETGIQIELRRFVGTNTSCEVGKWKWERIETSYPPMSYWVSENPEKTSSTRWAGAIRVADDDGTEFILFSFLASNGTIGDFYMVSTSNWNALTDFAEAVRTFMASSKNIVIRRMMRRDIEISPEEEPIILDSDLRDEIEQQVLTFFERPDLYGKAGIPYKRGLLFVGPPGTGKTMMVRNLLRKCHAAAHIRAWAITMNKGLDDDDIEATFYKAAHKAPSMIIIEDLDSLTTETQVSRAGFLAQMDGLSPRDGVLVVGTTNHPDRIDPALAHRPCRFDRIWKFDYPDMAMRLRYLKEVAGVKSALAEEIASSSEGWSFAYLNELKVTAGLMALEAGRTKANANEVRRAFDLISRQHQSGRKGHEITDPAQSLGFAVA